MSASPRIPERLQWTIGLVDVKPSDHLLEIGCGLGYAVALVCERLAHGTITAIDRSPVMVAKAKDRNRGCVLVGRARIEQRTLVDATFAQRFKKVFAINVNAFWTDPEPSWAALARLLHPGGNAFLTYEPPSESRLRELQRRLPQHLEAHKLAVVDLKEQKFRRGAGLCIIARPK